MDFSFNSVEIIPDLKAAATFTMNSSNVFKETESAKKTTLILCISNKSHYLCVEIKLVWKMKDLNRIKVMLVDYP